jgi:hypothetical protein
MEFYIFIVALTIFITTLVMTGMLKKYIVSQDLNASSIQMDMSSIQSTTDTQMDMSSMQSTTDTQMDMSSMQHTTDTKESFSYDNAAPLFIETKKPEDYIGDNRIYNPRPRLS